MKPWIIASLVVTGVALASLFAQEELHFLGRYDDVNYIEQPKEETSQIVFARLIYNGRIPGYYKNWYTDYPKADRLLMQGLRRLTNLNIADYERVIPINDPDLFKYPFIYTSEPEQMILTDEDAATLREYLARGGFWVLDDFWGSFEWEAMERQLRKVLPNAQIKDIPMNHPIFHLFFDVDQLMQTPSTAYIYNGGIAWEQDGFVPECKGVWDEHGRLIMVINHNTDLGDSYENADVAQYPYRFSAYGYRMAVNFFMYALTH